MLLKYTRDIYMSDICEVILIMQFILKKTQAFIVS
jgi:hypothetical protein